MKKSKKESKVQASKKNCKNKRIGSSLIVMGLWLSRVFLCILAAVIICSSLALLSIGKSKWQTHTLTSGYRSGNDKVRIYIDQGHNPAPHHNIGAEGNGLYEQDLTFYIGRALAELLLEDCRFDVCLSRPDESSVLGTDNASSLIERVDGATSFEADYFISLHINSYTDDAVNGIEVFVMEENSVSYDFGSCLLQGLIDSTDLKNRGMKLSSELFVLRNTTMPAALLEMGFISNVNDAALLFENPDIFAEGIYDGILEYFHSIYIFNVNLLLCVIGISITLAIIFIIVIFILTQRSTLKRYVRVK